MLTFKNFLKDNMDYDTFKKVRGRIVPALRSKTTKKVHKGRRGEEHIDIANKLHPGESQLASKTEKDYHIGYYDPKHKKFHGRYVHGYMVDTPDLMTRMQRIRRYGSE
jgi:hypothetical protein